jgi:hypothetical protein
MAIVGITDQNADFLRIGKLFKGEKKQKKQGEKGEYEIFGKELDHWRFESDIPVVKDAFTQTFGEKPQSIAVYLPFPTRDENWQTCKEAYTVTGLQHRCDGAICSRWLNLKTGKYESTPIPCPSLAMNDAERKRNGCVNIGRLKVFIPALGEVGFVTMETHSINDIARINMWLAGYESMRPDKLKNIPFSLYRYKEAIGTPRDNKRAKTDKWLVGLKPDSEWSRNYLTAHHRALIAQSFTPLALAAGNPPIEEDDEDDDIVHEGVVELPPEQAATTKVEPPAVATSALGKSALALKATAKMSDATFLKLVEEKWALVANTPAEAADGITKYEQEELIAYLKAQLSGGKK